MPPRTPKRSPEPRPPSAPPEIVDPRWLLKALAITFAVAVIFAYLSVCLLIYQGGWQRLLFPAHTVDKTPNVPFSPIRFDAAETGRPRLAGWWIPASSPDRPTILFLHGGAGSLSNTIGALQLLHRADLNLFAFDYRGYGESDPPHPTEARMNEDASAALNYLLNTRHIPASAILPYGQGIGAVLAANLANAHPDLPALILDNPDPEAFDRAAGDTHFHLLPTRALIRERFDLHSALANSTRPKLLFADTPGVILPDRVRTNQAFFRTLRDPKITVTFDTIHSEDAYLDSVRRFLDEYLPASTLALHPVPSKP